MKRILFLLFALAMFSCNRQSDFEKKLLAGKWVMHEGQSLTDEIDKWPATYYKFFDDGDYKIMHMPSATEMPGVDDIKPKSLTWRYIGEDKTLVIYGVKLKVLFTKADTIYMQRDTTNFMLYNIDKTYSKLKKGPGRCLGG